MRWAHVAPLARHEFPVETLAALARRCRVSLDGQGLVRVPEVGPLRLDADYDPELLRHVWALKLAEEEAEVVGDLHALGVREVIVTHGSRGATVHAGGTRRARERAAVLDADPTGAGDAFMTGVCRRPQRRLRAGRRRSPCNGGRRRGARPGDDRDRLDRGGRLRRRSRDGGGRAVRRASSSRPSCSSLNLPRLVAAAAAGATVFAVVDTKPPLVVSHDAGTTWRESGRGLPPGERSRSRTTIPTRPSTRLATAST